MGYNKQAGDQLPAAELNSFYASAGLYGASSTGNDSYAITVTPVPNDYDMGDTYTFKADVANTGAASLNVNSLGAKTIKKFGTLDLETGDIAAGQIVTVKYDGTNFQMESAVRPTPFFQQEVPFGIVLTGSVIFGSNHTGSVIYAYDIGTDKLTRFMRDSLTGMYIRTHQVSVSEPGGGWNIGSIVEIGSYIYAIVDTGSANMEVYRFLAADLTGLTTMTIPAVASSSYIVAWTNGTDIYVVSNSSNTTSRKWTISGTTLAASATYTVSSALTSTNGMSSFWDGSNAYLFGIESGNYVIRKLTSIDGTAYTETTKAYSAFGSGETSCPIGVIIDATKLYIGHKTDNFNATVVTASVINLIPITKP